MEDDGMELGEGLDLATIMATWTRQMGFPFVRVTRDYGSRAGGLTARVEQQRFLADPSSDTSTDYPDLG